MSVRSRAYVDLQHTPIPLVFIPCIWHQLSRSAPELAPKIAAEYLNTRLNDKIAEADPSPTELPPDASSEERLVQQFTHDPKYRFRELVEHSQHLYDLPAIAEAAPHAFLSAVWPWFVRAVNLVL